MACLLFATLPVHGSAAPPEFLTEVGAPGSGAGQLKGPNGVAAAPNGRIFVAETGNNRISEFTAWGEFVRAFGWGVADGTSELQACTLATSCVAGAAGSAPGQMDRPGGVAVDASGNLFVFERANARIQKFSPAGEFLLMVGGGVNEGPVHPGNLCTSAFIEEGDDCGAGTPGMGAREFLVENVVGSERDFITVGPDNDLYVADKGRIQRIGADGAFKSEFTLPENAKPANPQNANPGTLDADPKTGNLYFAFRQGVGIEANQPSGVYKLSSAGVLLAPAFESTIPKAIAADPDGNAFVSHEPFQVTDSEGEQFNFPEEVLEYSPVGNFLIGLGTGFASPTPELTLERITLRDLAENAIGNLVATYDNGTTFAYMRIYGPPPIALEDPPKKSPVVTEQYAVSVNSNSAVVRANVNPRYWNDTNVKVEYGTEPCHDGGCKTTSSVNVTSKVVNAPITSPGIPVGGLAPGTTYHYRVVAESGGGGPIFGTGEDPGSGKLPEANFAEGGEATFTTPPLAAPPQTDCSNQAFRIGRAALLPDCRAYEMVSPVDKNDSDIVVLCNINCFPAGLDQPARSGNALTYSSVRAFAEPESSPYTSQYLSERSGQGWVTKSISPPREGPSLYQTLGLDSQFKGFTDDLCIGWFVHDAANSLAPGSMPGLPNIYRRDNCVPGSGKYLTLTTVPPPAMEPNALLYELQGFSADGDCAVFRASAKLSADASSKADIFQVYAACGGEPVLVSVLVNGTASTASSSAGTAGQQANGRSSMVSNAVSDDGKRVFWTQAQIGPGPLFVRLVDTAQTQQISTSGRFWSAAANGSKAIYSEGEKLIEYDVASKAKTTIAEGVSGVAGASDDVAEIYFVSSKALVSGSTEGKPNLYLRKVGTGVTFIATVAAGDVSLAGTFSLVSPVPASHTASVSGDGESLTFMSRASLTGYDNKDVESGEPALEVFLYSAGEDALRCVSCLRSGARPRAQRLSFADSGQPWAAAQIPTAESQLVPPRVLSTDGRRLYFESFDPLVPGDSNKRQDVYQWEAPGTASCDPAEADGCLALISTGESPQASELVGIGDDGRDVFFKTGSSLVPQDPGLIDVYDARAEGGFPSSPSPTPPCQGESCQYAPPPPNDPTPASEGFHGPGDLLERPRRPRCPQGRRRVKVKGKSRCVKNRKGAKKHTRAKSRKRRGAR